MIQRIEVAFAVPVRLTDDQEHRLTDLIAEIARANTPAGHSHWLFSHGTKPIWSQADAAFLGKPVDPEAPESGEPSFDDAVLYFETAVREK